MKPQLLTAEIPADVSGWWISEKLDGVRAIWTGTALLTRNGHCLNPPASFTATLPNIRLDGELWMGRGTFDTLVSTIQTKGSDWAGVKFMVFDLADVGMFEDRYRKLLDAESEFPAHCEIVRHHLAFSNLDLDAMEKEIVAAGGEGCVIRRPGCKYRPGRMRDVIKIKRLVADIDRWQG
jgi:DNA ligase-1